MPEKTYPCGFNDCCNAVKTVRDKYPRSKLSLVGESAGANLCTAAALKYPAAALKH